MESNWRAWAGLMDETGSRYGISDKLFSEYSCICGIRTWPGISVPSSQQPASQARHCFLFASQATN